MKQLLTALALAGLAVACGDDDSTPAVTHYDGGGVDAGGPKADGGMDSGPPVAAKVNNAGAACTVATVATDCGGSSPTCAAATWAGAKYPGNQCEATCTADSECGGNGVCPIGAAIKSLGAVLSTPLMTTTGVCYQKCTAGAATCRAGYECKSTADALGGGNAAMVPGFTTATICVPVGGLLAARPGDGGVSDAGTVAHVDGGLDGGH